jgi:DNA-binding beta-propeller fold protein YncE
MNVEVKSGSVRTSVSSVLQYFKSVVPAALLLSVSVLGLGSTNALAQNREVKALDRPSVVPTGKLTILPGMGEGEQHEAQPEGAPKTTLNYPYGLAVDSTGNLYVANIFGGVTMYASKGLKYKGEITAGTAYPAAVAIAFGGNIYVANNGGNNVTIYNPSLQQVGTITDSSLNNPLSMYIDAANDVWVLDAAGTLHLYLDNGTPVGSVATGGGTAVGPWGPNVTVWGIPDGSGGYNEDYQNVGEALHYGPALPYYFPGGSPEAGGEAEDSLDQQYVTDVAHNQIQIWSASGLEEVALITTPSTPYGIAVDSVNKRIFVALTTSNEVLVYSTVAPYKLMATIH